MSMRCAPSCVNMPARDIKEIARVLTLKLRQVTDEFLAAENKHRPEYLKAILSPALAPGEQF